MPDPRWDAAERSFCFSVHMREIDLSGLASAVSTNIKSIFWLGLNMPNSLHHKYFTKAEKLKIDNFSLRLSLSSKLLVHIFSFSDSPLMTRNFTVSASSLSIDGATVNRKSQHRHGFITVSSTPQSGKGKSIHWFIFTLQNVLFFSGTEI